MNPTAKAFILFGSSFGCVIGHFSNGADFIGAVIGLTVTTGILLVDSF